MLSHCLKLYGRGPGRVSIIHTVASTSAIDNLDVDERRARFDFHGDCTEHWHEGPIAKNEGCRAVRMTYQIASCRPLSLPLARRRGRAVGF